MMNHNTLCLWGNYLKLLLNSRNCLQTQEAKNRSPWEAANTSAGVVVAVVVVDVVLAVVVVIVVVVVLVVVVVVVVAAVFVFAVFVFVVFVAAAAVLLLSSWALLQLPCAHRGLKQREDTKHCEKGWKWDFSGFLLQPFLPSVPQKVDLWSGFTPLFLATMNSWHSEEPLKELLQLKANASSLHGYLTLCCHALPLAFEMIIRLCRLNETIWE